MPLEQGKELFRPRYGQRKEKCARIRSLRQGAGANAPRARSRPARSVCQAAPCDPLVVTSMACRPSRFEAGDLKARACKNIVQRTLCAMQQEHRLGRRRLVGHGIILWRGPGRAHWNGGVSIISTAWSVIAGKIRHTRGVSAGTRPLQPFIPPAGRQVENRQLLSFGMVCSHHVPPRLHGLCPAGPAGRSLQPAMSRRAPAGSDTGFSAQRIQGSYPRRRQKSFR